VLGAAAEADCNDIPKNGANGFGRPAGSGVIWIVLSVRETNAGLLNIEPSRVTDLRASNVSTNSRSALDAAGATVVIADGDPGD
jgi:hypothetical protein